MSEEIEITSDDVKGITPSEFAKLHNYDPKSVRRVLRSMTHAEMQPGSAGRWEMDETVSAALLARMQRSHNKRVVIATADFLK